MRRTPITRKTALKPGQKPLRRRKALSPGQKPPKPGKRPQRRPVAPKLAEWERCHLQAVKNRPCRACGRGGPNDAHHCFHDRATRYGGRRAPHRDTIPLCKDCHQDGPEAIHRAKRSWREQHGPDWSHVPAVLAAIYGDPEITSEGIERFWDEQL